MFSLEEEEEERAGRRTFMLRVLQGGEVQAAEVDASVLGEPKASCNTRADQQFVPASIENDARMNR